MDMFIVCCSNCGAKQSSQTSAQQSSKNNDDTENNQSKWRLEFINIQTPDGKTITRYSSFCEACYQLRKL